KDVAKAQARKKDKNQQKTTQELQADEYLLGQGRFSEDRNPQNTDRESTRRPSNTNNERNPNSRQNRNNPNRNSQRSNDPNRAGSQSASDPNRSSQGNSARTGQVAAPSSSRSSGGTPAITLNARDMAAIQQLGGSLRELGNQVKSITADTVVPDNMKQQNNPDRDQPGKRGKDTSGPKI
ncbi:MAG: hypothetical protein EBV03_06215, partial [Proteobacteria bacterium]|nr:hypothetical protein [Pseudomonadota bacterium]